MHSNLSGPTKAVCYREVFAIRGVCYKRFHCIYMRLGTCEYTCNTYYIKVVLEKADKNM